MKKFSSIKELQPEKKRIRQLQRELENKIRGNWSELKESMMPVNLAKDAFSQMIKTKTKENLNGESLLKSMFSFGASLLAKRMADRAGEKLSTIFRKEKQ